MNMLNDAYSDILAWSEQQWPRSGGQMYRYLALQQASLLLPKIPFIDGEIRSNMHIMILGGPSMGKSAALRMYAKYAIRPLMIKRTTTAGVEGYLQLGGAAPGSIIVDDLSIILRDKGLVKTIEGVTEEGRVESVVHNRVRQYDVNIIGAFAGVPADLSSVIGGGWLSRVQLVNMEHSTEEQTEVGKYISEHIGISKQRENSFDDVVQHHKTLLFIQRGESRKYPPIVGAELSNSIRKMLCDSWVKTRKEIIEKAGELENIGWIRELQDGFRSIYASAFLHINKRKIKENANRVGLVVPTTYDAQLAVQLMNDSIRAKAKIWTTDELRNYLIKQGKLRKDEQWTGEQLSKTYWEDLRTGKRS